MIISYLFRKYIEIPCKDFLRRVKVCEIGIYLLNPKCLCVISRCVLDIPFMP